MMVGISERLLSEPLPYGRHASRHSAARHACRGTGFDGPERHWAASALPLLSRWLVAVTKGRLAKAYKLAPSRIGSSAASAHPGTQPPPLREAS